MTETEIITLFRQSQALLEGHFQLSSGRHSDRYFQCALILQDPVMASKLGEALGNLLHEYLPVSAVAAPAIGGILVAHEVARALRTRAVFTERINGKMTLRRGFALQPGDRVVVVEDVITTGLSTRETIQAVKEWGAQVPAIGALIDRSGGTVGASFSAPFRALAQVKVQSYSPADCPLCRNAIPVVKPGSRV